MSPGRRVRSARLLAGLTQADPAKAVDVAPAYISQIEGGSRSVQPLAARLGPVLGVDIAYLTDGVLITGPAACRARALALELADTVRELTPRPR